MKGKKLVGFAVVCLIAILCVFVIAGAIVPKNFSFEFDDPSSIKILNVKTGSETIDEGTEQYEKILELFNKGFKVNYLEAIFQGKGFQNVTTLDETKSAVNSLSADNTLYIQFNYSADKQVNLHGDISLELTESEQTYRSVVLEIKKSNNLIQVSAYLKDDFTSSTSYVRYVSYAKLSELYNYLNENFEF